MKTVQTIELSDDERLVISKTLKLIDQISNITNSTMCETFDYFVDNSDMADDGCFLVKALHNIEDMRGTV